MSVDSKFEKHAAGNNPTGGRKLHPDTVGFFSDAKNSHNKPEDKRQTLRQEHTSHFTNRAPKEKNSSTH